jgi:hypothetical protein
MPRDRKPLPPRPRPRRVYDVFTGEEELDPATEFRPPPVNPGRRKKRKPLVWPDGDAWVAAEPRFVAWLRAITSNKHLRRRSR